MLVPYSLTILPTYVCSAACPSCSLECSPVVKSPRISKENILKYIKEATECFPTIKVVVFTGGECTLIGDDLFAAISYANRLSLSTRVVTNGSWAKTENSTRKKIDRFVESGLTEINFSTGDEHAMFVDVNSIVKAAIICAQNGIRAGISVEGHGKGVVKGVNLLKHPLIDDFYNADPSNIKKLIVFTNVWMSIDNRVNFEQADSNNRFSSVYPFPKGCNNVVTNIVVNPEEQLSSCCGLTFENIKEMKVGSLKTNTMKSLFDQQVDDFMKLWLHAEGPEEMMKFAKEKDPTIELPEKSFHICEACAYMYMDDKIRNALKNHYHEKVNDVLFNIELKKAVVLN